MNSWDLSRRAELRENARLLGRRILPFLIVFVAGLGTGLWIMRPREQPTQVVEALKDNADSLRVVRSIADSLKHVDSVATAAVLARRPVLARLNEAVQVSPDVRDSTVVVKGPARGTDNEAAPPFTVALPLPVAMFIREAKLQLAADTVLLHVKDLRIGALEKADSLNQVRDSLHIEYEHKLEAQRDGAFRRGVVRGVTGTIKVAAVIIVAVKVVAIARR